MKKAAAIFLFGIASIAQPALAESASKEIVRLSSARTRAPVFSAADLVPIAGEVSSPGNRLIADREIATRQSVEIEEIGNERSRFAAVMVQAREESWQELSFGEIVQSVALAFEGEPYAANLLDRNSQETLVVSLEAFDCVLYVEAVLAIARGIAAGDASYDGFLVRLEDQRYAGGQLDSYCNRLHYFSHWLRDNEARGNAVDVIARLGGEARAMELFFMSENWELYPRQMESEDNRHCIAEMERSLGEIDQYYIPTAEINASAAWLQPGDIIAIATEISGLDVSHTGLVYMGENGLGLLHASTDEGITVAENLQEFVEETYGATGIVVGRAIDPRQRNDDFSIHTDR